MPKNKKPAGGRPAKNFDPDRAKKAGSRSPGHRGYRPDADAPKKARWSKERREVAGSGGARGPQRDRDESRDSRGGARRDGADRAPRADRSDRPESDRPREYRGRPARRDERPAAGRYRSDRYEDRPRDDRGAGGRDERPRYEREDRPRYDRAAGDRPRYDRSRDDRPREDRPRYDRSAGDRPRYDRSRDDRPREDRPRYDRSGDDRPRTDRPRNDRFHSDRPRTERPVRRFDRDRERPARDHDRDSDFYPSRSEGRFTPQDDVVLERLTADAIQAEDVEGVSFGDLGLGNNIVRELAELGATAPFPIQAATIPEVLAGRDVLGRGRTGSGKTIAFGAPLVEKLMENGGGKKRQMGRAPRALILAPTRELALQIDRTVQPIARSVGLFTTQIYGGVPQHRQVGALQRGVDIVIGTPGRIEDLIEQRKLDLSNVTVTVLDEADHMCDLGFLEPVQRILRRTAEGGQKLLFSATLDTGVAALVNEFLVDPAVHEVAGEDQASGTIDHRVLLIEHRDKGEIIEQLAQREGKTLIFTRTRAFAEQLADRLEDAGIDAVSLHGDLNQSRRTRNLEKLTSGRVSVLVATDVAARGIHVDDIELVIQADPPDEYKTYLHRSGRTGRAGKEGRVVTLIPRQRRRRMEELLGRAEIEAEFDSAMPGDQVITDIATA
jgi:superfamily II DNA/RNA helicase